MKIYLVTNESRNEPENVRASTFIHIKAKVDGSQTIILTEESLVDEKVEQLDQEQAQALLNSWINDENEHSLEEGVEQSYINLGVFFA